MRSVIALLGGIAISVIGLAVVLDTTWELAGVAMIIAGVVVAARGMRPITADRDRDQSSMPGSGWEAGHGSIVGWPSGLRKRLARRSSASRRAD